MPAVAMSPARAVSPARIGPGTRSAAAVDGPAPVDAAPAGRHRRARTARACVGQAVDVAGHVGSLVSLAALLVLATSVGGMADGMPVGAVPTVTVTFDSGGH